MSNPKRIFQELLNHMDEDCARKMQAEFQLHFAAPSAAAETFLVQINRLTKRRLFIGWEDFQIFCRVERGFAEPNTLPATAVYRYFFDADSPTDLESLIDSEMLSGPRFTDEQWLSDCFIAKEG